MTVKNKLIIGGSITSLLLGVAIYAKVKSKNQDKFTALLLKRINETIKPESSGLNNHRAFQATYKDEVLKKVKGKIILLRQSTANRWAKEIKVNFRSWWQGGDQELPIYTVFRQLKDQVQVAQVAEAFENQKYGNLLEMLQDRFGQDEIKKVLQIVNRLPAYRKI